MQWAFLHLFFSQDTQATQQNDVQNLMQQVKQTSQILVHQNVDERYFFSVLSQLNETIALLNDVVRSMSKPVGMILGRPQNQKVEFHLIMVKNQKNS